MEGCPSRLIDDPDALSNLGELALADWEIRGHGDDETGALFPDQLPRIWLILVGQRPKDRRVAAHGRRPVTAMRLVVIVVVRRVPAAANACDRQRSVGWFGSPLPIVGDVDGAVLVFRGQQQPVARRAASGRLRSAPPRRSASKRRL